MRITLLTNQKTRINLKTFSSRIKSNISEGFPNESICSPKNCNFGNIIFRMGLFRGKNNINDFESLIKCQTDKCGICGDDLSYMKE